MRRLFSYLVVCACVLSACSAEPDAERAAEVRDETQLGTLRLPLVGRDGDLTEYRLRAATFDVQGVSYYDYQSVSTTLSTESDPDGRSLQTRLIEGYYTVSLRPQDWYLERMTADGPVVVEQALLLSSASQTVFVSRGGNAQIVFQFGVDGTLVDFVGGELTVDIAIQRAPDAGR